MAEILGNLGFSQDKDGDGFVLLLALCKRVSIESAKKLLEEAVTSWWNGSENGRVFYSPKHIESSDDTVVDTLLVVFSSLGFGLVRPEWGGTLSQLGVFEKGSRYKVLHVLDPAYR